MINKANYLIDNLKKKGLLREALAVDALIRKYSRYGKDENNIFYLDLQDKDFPEIKKKFDEEPIDLLDGLSDIVETFEPASFCYFDAEESSLKIIVPICEVAAQNKLQILTSILKRLENALVEAGYIFYYDEKKVFESYKK